MKRALLALAACSDPAPAKPPDSGLTSDAPALACSQTSGTKVTMRLVATTNGGVFRMEAGS